MFPEVILVDDKVVTEEQGIYSSGGAFSYLNLILHIIEKYAGRDMAILCSKVFTGYGRTAGYNSHYVCGKFSVSPADLIEQFFGVLEFKSFPVWTGKSLL